MDTKSNIEINLKVLWGIFLRKWWSIGLVVIVTLVGIFTFNKISYTPEYSSTATMYILRQANEESSIGEVSQSLSVATSVVKDCDYLIKSDSVVDVVKSSLGLSDKYDSLSKKISTRNPSGTRILEITVVAESPEIAKEIVDSLAEVGAEKINEAMGYSQVSVYQNGRINTNPSNKMSAVSYLLIAAVAAVAAFIIHVLIYMLDDTLRTDEDCQHYLGLTVLGDIPNAYENNKKKNKYYYYRRSYGNPVDTNSSEVNKNE